MIIEKIKTFTVDEDLNKKIQNNIEGWFPILENYIFDFLLNMQNNYQISGNLCEIGIWHGKSLMKLIEYNKNNIVYGFDYKLKTDIINNHIKDLFPKINFDNIKLYKDVSQNIANYNLSNVRFCHIDGAHSGDLVYIDIINANGYMDDKGILILDDFDKEYIGIIQAYYKAYFTNNTKFVPILMTDRKLYLCTVKYYNLYYNFIKNNFIQFVKNYNINNISYIIEIKNTCITNIFRITTHLDTVFNHPFDGIISLYEKNN